MKKEKYFVGSKCDGKVEIFRTDSSLIALDKWFSKIVLYNGVASISCGTLEDCLELYKTYLENYRDLHMKYKGGKIRFMYILDMCKKYLMNSEEVDFEGCRELYGNIPLFVG